ncbi:MAG TPA: adenylate/guanylate cyclase domain-containing protein, partial [Aggregatilineales bacterium]|nr:adenylate/guanylate cyclase domain-containing protein [Aggregatilineales bacterium]
MAISQEQLLHNLEPYLPTDRFRAIIAGKALDDESTGAAMFVDVSGFTPLTVSLVEEFGPQRASEELKRRLNPMFEAVAGLVFTHGGSVIRFVGDGFTAWFPDELQHTKDLPHPLPGIVRASIAALEMLEIMVFFRELDLKVAVNQGSARRWIVGNPERGLIDIIVGSAIEVVAEVSNRCQRHEVRAAAHNAEILRRHENLEFTVLDDGDLLLKKCEGLLVEQSRAHRWHAWKAEGDIETILETVKQFIDPLIQEQETADLGGLSGELRYATPVFLRFTGLDYNNDPDARDKLDSFVRDVQEILKDSSGRLVSLEVADKGSVIFAVFGAPISYGDDSRRAVHAALTLRDLPQIHPYIVSQNIGASRGLLYSGTVGGEVRHEYTSLGDETNVASRLMSHDHTGRIFISEAVYEDASEWFEYEEGEVIQPKGRVGKVRTYIPIRPTQRVRRDLRRSPIVGRSSELDSVHRALEAVGRGRAHILRIEGEAGIGKSRLAAEIAYQSRER